MLLQFVCCSGLWMKTFCKVKNPQGHCFYELDFSTTGNVDLWVEQEEKTGGHRESDRLISPGSNVWAKRHSDHSGPRKDVTLWKNKVMNWRFQPRSRGAMGWIQTLVVTHCSASFRLSGTQRVNVRSSSIRLTTNNLMGQIWRWWRGGHQHAGPALRGAATMWAEQAITWGPELTGAPPRNGWFCSSTDSFVRIPLNSTIISEEETATTRWSETLYLSIVYCLFIYSLHFVVLYHVFPRCCGGGGETLLAS